MQEGNGTPQRATPNFQDLNDRERKAVEMRYLGHTYAEIAGQTSYHEGSVRKLFMSNGRLAKAYEQYADTQRTKAQDNTEQALAKAKGEAMNALERIINLSQNAQTEGGIFKANEFLLQLAGVTQETALRSFFQAKTYEQAQRIVNDLFMSIYGRGMSICVEMGQITKNGVPLKFDIGTQEAEPPEGGQE